jgi:hypothetical protein
MAISVFPTPVVSSLNASAITATAANTMYEALLSLDPAIYTVTCASATVTRFEFYSGASTLVTKGQTVSGTVSINVASSADRIRLWTDTGSNVVVTITKTASSLTNQFSGTLDTVTATGTYTGTSTSGFGYCVLVGGGGGGSSSVDNNSICGGGGGGGVAIKLLALTGSMAVTIGAAGANGAATGTAGGNSTFSTLTANGGSGGIRGAGGGTGGTATGGEYNLTGTSGGAGSNNGGGDANGGSPDSSVSKFAVATIGTGGSGASGEGDVGTGYGAGGGGGKGGNAGANGTAGVLYVLRF